MNNFKNKREKSISCQWLMVILYNLLLLQNFKFFILLEKPHVRICLYYDYIININIYKILFFSLQSCYTHKCI